MTRRYKKSRRSHKTWDYQANNPCEGLGVNSINDSRFVAKRRTRISMFDADNICIKLGNGYHSVSVMKDVYKVNRLKTMTFNGYKYRINGKE